MNVSLKDYSIAVLGLYARLPDTPAKIRSADRRLLEQLYSRGIPLSTLEAALFLASARRICRDPAKPSLPQIRSLAYFLPVIEELSQNPLPAGYLTYVRSKVSLKPIS
jgi:hypothetical protein